MDDQKLIWRSDKELRNEIRFVKSISNGVKIWFGLEKCAKVSLKSVKVHTKQSIGNTVKNEIKE
jgi:hypothetical protein